MKRITCIVLIISMVGISNAQWYLNFQTGYSLALNPEIQQNRVVTDNIIKLFRIRFSYGNGLNTSLGGGYIFPGNIFAGVEAVTSFFSTSHSDNNWEYYFMREYEKLHLSGLNGDVVIKNYVIQVAPVIGYSISSGKIRPFIKAGLNLLYMMSMYTNDYTYKYFTESRDSFLEYTHLERKRKGKIDLGIRGSAGVLYPIGDRFCLSADLTIINSMYRFNKPEIVSFKVNGVETANDEELYESSVDFTNLGFNMGIRYTF